MENIVGKDVEVNILMKVESVELNKEGGTVSGWFDDHYCIVPLKCCAVIK